MTNISKFPDILRNLRMKLNLSQEALASRIGVAFATVNRWEAGTSKPQRAQRDSIERLITEAGLNAESLPPNGAFDIGANSTAPAAEKDGETTEVGMPATHEGRRRRGVSKSSVLGMKSMEQMLWDAACKVRG